MNHVRELSAIQLDALREVANIGAGHGATALAVMTERRVMISVPRSGVAALEDVPELLGDPEAVVAATLMRISGDLTGRMLVLLSEPDARILCDVLLRRASGGTRRFGPLEESALKEVSNILGGAYLNAMAEFLGMMLLPSMPALAVDYCGAVLTSAHLGFSQDRDFLFYVETDFSFDERQRPLRGHLLLLPDLPALQAILEIIRLT